MAALRPLALLVLSVSVSVSLPARADDPPRDPDANQASVGAAADAAARDPSSGRRALALTTSVVPGVLVHGAGHFALGKRQTAVDLLLFEGLGLGMILGGGSVIALTGASRYVVGPAAAVTFLGFGVFGASLLADVYGSASPDPGAATLRRPLLPLLETEFGYRRVEDVQFSHHDFLAEGMRLNHKGLSFGLSGLFSLGADNARYRGELGYRFIDDSRPDAHYFDRLELTGGVVRHVYATDGFAMTSGELAVWGRYDLSRVGATLSGAFAEFGVGYARGFVHYDLSGQHVPNDAYGLLLGGFGFGARLRGASAPGSEALFYYDHRHDDFAAGLKTTGLLSGPLGHFGFRTKWFFGSSAGVLADVSVGSAWVFGASLLLRQPMPGRRKERVP